MNAQNSGFTPSRRTLVKGAAWSVPVVAVAGASPAFAASQWVEFIDLGLACKLPGNSCSPYRKGYLITAQVCTNVRGTVTIDFGTANGTLCGEARTWGIAPDPLVINGSSDGSEVCQTVRYSLTDQSDSSNCDIQGSVPFTWTSSNGLSGSGTAVFSSPTTPPCDNCQQPPAGTTAIEEPTDQADVKLDEAPATSVEESTVESDGGTTDVAPPATDNASTTSAP